MSAQEKRGWVWTNEEKMWAKGYSRFLRNRYNFLDTQLARYHKYLPKYKAEVSEILQPFFQVAKALLRVDSRSKGHKYQKISAEDAKIFLEKAVNQMKLFSEFTRRSDVSLALAQVNRKLKEKVGELEQALDKKKEDLLIQLDSGAYDDEIKTTCEFIKITLSSLEMTRGTEFTEKEKFLYQTMLMIYFVKTLFYFNETLSGYASELISNKPDISIDEVVHSVIIKDLRCHLLSKFSSLGPLLNFGIFLLPMNTTRIYMEKWIDSGKSIKDITPEALTLQGRDFSNNLLSTVNRQNV